MTGPLDDLFVFSGESNIPLAQAVCNYIGVPLQTAEFKRFSNDNLWVQLGGSVRGKNVYIIQSLSVPVSDHLMQLGMMLNIAKAGDANSVTAVIPYYSYARSDKKDAPRICIAARLVADLIQAAGADRVIAMTLHSDQVHGFFSVPFEHLTSHSVFIEYFAKYSDTDTVIVSPDVGYAKHVVKVARALKLPVAIGSKMRLGDDEVKIDAVLGSGQVAKRAIVLDDEIATGSSMIELMDFLRAQGTQEFILACTHGVFTNQAAQRLSKIDWVKELVTTDTVYLPPDAENVEKLQVLSIARVLGEGIRRTHVGESMGSLFTFWPEDMQ